jgi:predicted DNA-binding transcriptional regulator YafY
VEPYHVMEHQGRLYMIGRDMARDDIRKFVLGRMMELERTGERFKRPKDFDPRKHFESSLGVMTGKGDYQVVIEMDAWLTDILRGRRFHRSQVVKELPNGGSHLEMRLSALEEVEQFVLSWGTHATVIEPVELRQRILKTARELAARYA